jgi:DNA-binding NarL/FixJ family response regulator
MIRVLVVEHFPTTAAVIRTLLAASTRLAVVGEAEDGPTALRLVAQAEPDVIILDGALGHRNGHALIRELRVARPDARLIVLSDHPEPQYQEAAVAAGADRLILKVHLVKELLPAIRSTLPEAGPP